MSVAEREPLSERLYHLGYNIRTNRNGQREVVEYDAPWVVACVGTDEQILVWVTQRYPESRRATPKSQPR